MESCSNENTVGLQLTIDKTWDGSPIDHEPIDIQMRWHFERVKGQPHKRVVLVTFDAPLFDDPEAPSEPAGIMPGLWNYEVVEFFFANDKNQYLEVEVGPHGHWLCLLFDGVRKSFNDGEELELQVKNQFIGNTWHCELEIPLAYFPSRMTKMNCYAIHGTDPDRKYEAAFPVTDGTYKEPDFHRLEFFNRFSLRRLFPEGYGDKSFADHKYGDLWQGH